jgi:hypothetical protein
MDSQTWSTFWQAVEALAAVAAIVFTVWQVWKRNRPKKKCRLFLSMQMSELYGDKYIHVRRDIMQLVYELREQNNVYFFNEYVQEIEKFEESRFDVDKYLKKIDECDYFIAVISDKVLSSIYFEAAYALACGKRSVYFVTNDKVMPLVMRKLASSRSEIQFFRTTELQDIKITIQNILGNSANIAKVSAKHDI